jgi:hypothetical protein
VRTRTLAVIGAGVSRDWQNEPNKHAGKQQAGKTGKGEADRASIFLFSAREPGYALKRWTTGPGRGEAMKKIILLAVALGSAASAASAAPLFNQAQAIAGPASLTHEVRVVCEANGVCYRPPGRPLVAQWVYGDGAFYGPYVGPGNYGAPGKHYNMTPSWFLWWN